MWNGIDRRKFPRVHYKCLIYLRRKDSSKTINTYTENLGAGGLCVILKEDLGLFQGVSLEIDLENGVPGNIKCSGTVVWVIKKRSMKEKGALQYDTGIEFVDIKDEGSDRISKIVDANIKNIV
jgi:Tfp pilus assembly protein PilZ